jgi:hypothetical protein
MCEELQYVEMFPAVFNEGNGEYIQMYVLYR